MTYMLLLNCALKLVEEIILNYDTRSKKHQITLFLLITNLTHFFFNVFIYLFHFSKCFEQPSAHHQENQIVSKWIYLTSPLA